MAAIVGKRPSATDHAADLQKEAQAEFSNYRRTHDQLRGLLAKSYLWWRKAELAECLESLYRDADIA
ncbi:MAG: hypothetical protein WBF07_00925, partial [Xanthobacteraceae bacterium]